MNYAKTSKAKFHETLCHASLPRKEKVNGKKVKVHPKTGHEGQEKAYMFSSTLYLTPSLDGVGGQCHAPAALPPERPGTPCIGNWVGLKAGLDWCGKCSSHQDSIPGPSGT